MKLKLGSNVLVTGAAGFICSHLVERLRSMGLEVAGINVGSGMACTLKELTQLLLNILGLSDKIKILYKGASRGSVMSKKHGLTSRN